MHNVLIGSEKVKGLGVGIESSAPSSAKILQNKLFLKEIGQSSLKLQSFEAEKSTLGFIDLCFSDYFTGKLNYAN